MEKVLYGSESNNCAAFCKHHNCYMTVKQIKTKGCLCKQCWYLQKNDEHEYWAQRERLKEKKKMNKKITMEAFA